MKKTILLTAASNREIEIEQIRRAMVRTEQTIEQFNDAILKLSAKNVKRWLEIQHQQTLQKMDSHFQ